MAVTSELPVWIVATYRTEQMQRGHPLVAFVGAVARGHRYEEVRLAGLQRDEIRVLVSAIFAGIEVANGFVDTIHTRTGPLRR